MSFRKKTWWISRKPRKDVNLFIRADQVLIKTWTPAACGRTLQGEIFVLYSMFSHVIFQQKLLEMERFGRKLNEYLVSIFH